MAAPPLYLTPVPKADVLRGDGALVTQFIEGTPDFVNGTSTDPDNDHGYCRVTKESLGGSAGQLIRLRPWQHNIAGMTYARQPNGRLRHRQAMIGLPRKNGKSALGSSFGLYGLVMSAIGSEIYSCAADKDQARIVFEVAKRMVEMDEELSSMIHVYRDSLVYEETGSIYKVLSSEAFTKEGLNPTTIIFDELHALPNPDMYNVMSLAQGTRRDPLLIVITTAGVKTDQTGQDSVCYRMFQQGVKISKGEDHDDSFFMAWWGAPDGANYRDEKVWAKANPGYDDLIDPEDFRSVIKRIPENEFRTKRLNQWTNTIQAWLPQGAWDACKNDEPFTPGPRGVVLGFDGSSTGDNTAIVAIAVDTNQVKVLGLWEKPLKDSDNWRVPRDQVKDALRNACTTYNVREIAADPWLWQDALEELADEGLPIVQFPQHVGRMGPATQRFYEAVINKTISHDGDPALARHLDNAKLKLSSKGNVLTKENKSSPRKIDLAVASVMAEDRAGYYLTQEANGYVDGVAIEDVGFVW